MLFRLYYFSKKDSGAAEIIVGITPEDNFSQRRTRSGILMTTKFGTN